MEGIAHVRPKLFGSRQWMLVWGPGLLVMLADTDAGNVVTGAQAGAQWGYRLLPMLLVLAPMLYMLQELTVRLGLYTGRGHGELIRERFGLGWAWLSTAGLAAAAIGSLVTEFTGVAGIGELYGLSRSVTLPLAAAALLAVVATGSYRRVERAAIVIGLFELAFFAVAWAARPSPAILAGQALDLPLGDREFMYLAAAVIGSLITEFTGVAGIGELYGLSRGFTLPLSAAALLAVVATGSYRRVERTAIVIGLFELAFFVVAWAAHPSLGTLAEDAVDLPLGNHEFLYMVAAIIGATFNPWMIFYQQSAVADKKLRPDDLQAARWDTAFGAVLTQCLTGAVLVAAAATLASGGASAGLDSVGQISAALSPLLGESFGRLVFSAGVLGASLVAAIVCSLALAWGVGEIAGYKHSLEHHPFAAKWFYGVYALAVVGSAALVGFASDLVWLNIAAQVLNAFLLPLVIGFLVALAVKALPAPLRPRGLYLAFLIGVCAVVIAVGLYGGVAGLL